MENRVNPVFRLSPQQAMIWLAQTESAPLNVVAEVRFQGTVQPERLRQAVAAVASRHEILRTVSIPHAGLKIPFQEILDLLEPAWDVLDLDEDRIDQLFFRETQRQFDMEHGPLVYAHYVSLPQDRAVLVLTLPALLSDWPSLAIIIEQIASAYAGSIPSSDDEPFRYVQFAQWQADTIESKDETASEAKEFWRRQKEAGPDLALPEENAGATEARPAVVSAIVPAMKSGASEETLLLAVWQSLLWRLTGQQRFTTRVFVEGREFEELKDALGPVGKFVPVSARFEGDFSFADVVAHLNAEVPAAAYRQEYFHPGDGAESGSAVAFEYLQTRPSRDAGSLKFEVGKRWAFCEKFALKLSVSRNLGNLALDLSYDAARINPDAAARWIGSFKTLLAGALESPEKPLSRLALLNEGERRQIVEEWNRTAQEYPRDRCFHELFEAQAERTPDRPAVRSGRTQITYRELNERANRLAHYLRRLGVAPGCQVGLCLDRGVEMMIALMAIVKAGAAYVPLNADNPKPRLAQQAVDAVALITETKLADRIPQFTGSIIFLDRDEQNWSGEASTNPAAGAMPDHTIYVIFTSGSTGTSKGVAVRHRNLVNYASFMAKKLGAADNPDGLHCATVSTLSADLGNTCIFPALLSGGCVHVVGHDIAADSALLAAYEREFPIDVLKIVPSHLQALLETSQGASILPRKVLVTGGETLTASLVRRIRELAPQCAILNHYGPTETTVGSLTFLLEEGQGGFVPIGRPIANTQVYILDAFRQPVPIGVKGELYIAGDGVAAGYLNQPELTRERFVDNPFGPGKMYRTGDVARYRADGNVEFLGREDDQVKVRGFRIELGEVEAALAKHPAVKQAIVIARRDARDEVRLIAYVVPIGGSTVTSGELREFLRDQLPEYMIPAAVGVLPKLPLTANGKIDRQNLPEPEQIEERIFQAPRTPTEEALTAIWSEVFRRERVGVTDNFFEMGGHSLMATQVISRVRERFRVTMDMRVLFDGPTVEAMAEAVQAAQAAAPERMEAGIVAVSRERYRRT